MDKETGRISRQCDLENRKDGWKRIPNEGELLITLQDANTFPFRNVIVAMNIGTFKRNVQK